MRKDLDQVKLAVAEERIDTLEHTIEELKRQLEDYQDRITRLEYWRSSILGALAVAATIGGFILRGWNLLFYPSSTD